MARALSPLESYLIALLSYHYCNVSLKLRAQQSSPAFVCREDCAIFSHSLRPTEKN